MGVAPAQREEAEDLWQRASSMVDHGYSRNAMSLLYRCAHMGDRRAEATLGIRYQEGDGVKADDHAAAYWFGLVAAQGHRASQYALAGMYQSGEGGVPKDLVKSAEYLTKSANQGYAKAQLALGVDHEFGEGVPRSRAKAIAMIRQSGLANEIASLLANPRTPRALPTKTRLGLTYKAFSMHKWPLHGLSRWPLLPGAPVKMATWIGIQLTGKTVGTKKA